MFPLQNPYSLHLSGFKWESKTKNKKQRNKKNKRNIKKPKKQTNKGYKRSLRFLSGLCFLLLFFFLRAPRNPTAPPTAVLHQPTQSFLFFGIPYPQPSRLATHLYISPHTGKRDTCKDRMTNFMRKHESVSRTALLQASVMKNKYHYIMVCFLCVALVLSFVVFEGMI